jgi:phenylalanyl-tRNA synthetase beta chain
MTISYNWLKDYIKTSLTAEEIAAVLTATGLEVEAVEKIEAIPGGLKGVVVGEVLECEKHPDADRLRITKVNLGEGEPVQIVCGAPNVAAGQKVLVATIGAKLYPVEGEPFTIKKGKIRGQESLGMICAEDELGLGKGHDGIMVLDANVAVGTEAAKYLNIEEDYTLEIGLTPNRTDAISHYGVARDLVAALRNMKGITDAALIKPSMDNFKEGNEQATIAVAVENSEACPRYSSIEIKNIKVEASPKWLQERLAAIGLRPINNVVDITNYVQHELGQPLHAFDAAEIGGNKVVVRLANEGEKIKTLDEVERTLTANDLVICDSEKPMCIAGVFGGINSGVTEKTTRVFLESAYFNPVFVRKTARRQALNTDSSFRFERGCDPSITVMALQRAAQLMVEIAGGEVATAVNDVYPTAIQPKQITFRWDKAFTLIGKKLEKDAVKNILRDLEIEILSENEEALELSIPLYRTDVTREADVVEEILRIYGYDNIESPSAMRISLQSAQKPDVEALQNKVSDFLTSNGFSEMMSMSLTKSKYLELAQDAGNGKETVVELLNPLSGDLAIMRQNLLYSGLEAIAYNRNHRNPDLRLYEFGKVYHKFGEKYNEEKRLALFLSGRKQQESWNNSNEDVSFSDLKGAFENILQSLRVAGARYQAFESSSFDDALECSVGKNVLARLGCVSGSLLKSFDIKQTVWYAEILWENILKMIPKAEVKYREPEKFPAVRRDLSLLLDKSVKYAEIERIAMESEKKVLRSVNLFDVYEGKNLEAGKKSYAVSFVLQDSSKTMTDEQSEQAMARIQKALEEKLGATLRA